MFVTYLGRELRRRMRQAVFIALGLAVGIGLVITVTAAASGVKDAQGTVLHSLYGVGTDITVTKAPSRGTGGPFGFRVQGRPTGNRPKAGEKFSRSVLMAGSLGSIGSSSVTKIARTKDVAAAAGALSATDLTISGTIPSSSSGSGGVPGGGGGGGRPSSFKTNSFAVLGVDTTAGRVGPLSSGKIASGTTFTAAQANSDVAARQRPAAALAQVR